MSTEETEVPDFLEMIEFRDWDDKETYTVQQLPQSNTLPRLKTMELIDSRSAESVNFGA